MTSGTLGIAAVEEETPARFVMRKVARPPTPFLVSARMLRYLRRPNIVFASLRMSIAVGSSAAPWAERGAR